MAKSSLNLSELDVTLSFPFLCEQETMRLIKESKVMFIMRGLPGSGKSTIARNITSAYPSSVICSANDYFMQKGVYEFNPSGLQNAHSSCQNKTRRSCKSNVGVVIVDNTNVRRLEMEFYLDLAKEMDYVVILVEPKTAWKLNPLELAAKNVHGVRIGKLRSMVDQFEDVFPVYYAWFLNDHSSKQLASKADGLLRECMQLFPDFADRLLKQLGMSSAVNRHRQQCCGGASAETAPLRKYYPKEHGSGNIFHCTAKYCGGDRAYQSRQYHSRERVQNALGQAFTLEISSICFSPRTVGARVQLKESQFVLFDKPADKHGSGMKPHLSSAKPPRGASAAAQGERAHGRSAHITVGCAKNVKPNESNFDVLRLCDMEATGRGVDKDYKSVTGGKARYFGDGVCCVYFDRSLHVNTIFSGFY